jgi:hypothetical protein
MRSNEFCPSLAIMVADCEKLCTKYTVDFSDQTQFAVQSYLFNRKVRAVKDSNRSYSPW